MLFPCISFGVVNVKASLTLSDFKYLFSKIFCSFVCRVFSDYAKLEISKLEKLLLRKFLTKSPDEVGGT